MRVSNVDFVARASLRVMRPLRGTAAILLLSSMVSVGSAGAALAQTFRFATIDVQGNELIDDDTIAGFARIVRNRSMSAADMNAAYQRVAATGFFRSVDFEPQGNRLVIRVQEYPLINRISIEGNRRLDDDELSALLQSRPGGVYSPSQAEADANALAEAYAQRGRLAARIEPRLIERAGGRVDLVFEVAEGQVAEVERVSFVGNRSFSERHLRGVIDTSQAGRLSTLFRSDNYNAERIARDRQALQDYYMSRGFLDAQILSGVSELTLERDGAFVTFTIREGQQYRLGNVSVISEISGIEPGAYRAGLTDRTGQLFTPTLLETMIQQVERVGYEAGQRFVRAEPRLVRNEREGTVDVEFALVRGDRVFIERIDIQGNTTTQERVIRRQFHVAEGDPLNPRELREAAARIQATGYFSDVQVNPVGGSNPQEAVVDVQVEETTTGSLGFGLSYGASEGMGGNISYNETNFMGRGQHLSLTFSTVPDSRSLALNFTEPSLMGRDLAFGLQAGLITTSPSAANPTSDGTRFGTQTVALTPSLTFPVSEYGRLALRASVNRTAISTPRPWRAISPRILMDRGMTYTSSAGFTYTYDTRRNGPNPDRGFIFTFSQDIAGLGGDREWARSTLMAGYERQMLNGDVTLRAEFEAGAAYHQAGPSNITERFALGSDQMRGFEAYGIGPVGYGPNGARNGLGGNYFAVARLEAEFPLGLPQDYNVHGGLFMDIGSLWGIDAPTPDVVDDQAVRATAGFSVFWGSPLGPLRFNFMVPLQNEAYDRTRRFDLTIATRF